jgi:hypothetical protein
MTTRIDASAQITRWRAEKARQEGQRRRDRRRGPGYRWPADRTAIIAVTMAAAREIGGVEAGPRETPEA